MICVLIHLIQAQGQIGVSAEYPSNTSASTARKDYQRRRRTSHGK
jgi:hypothetical protein